MEILLVGGAGSFMDALVGKIKKEGHRIYGLTGSKDQTADYPRVFEKYCFPYDSECIKEICESVNPDVVVFMGDNTGDLPINSYHKSQQERNALVDQHKDEFGKRFIVFPNPSYGDWEPALKQDDKFGSYWGLTAEQKSELRKKSLRGWQPKGNAKDGVKATR